MAEDYIESIQELLKQLKVRVYCRVGAMYDSVPHTRPIVVTGNPGAREPRPGVPSPLIQQRQSTYQGPTSIMNTVTDTAAELGIDTMNFMAHLPHYAQMEEDYAGTARMLQALAAYYEIPTSLAPTRRGEAQYRELQTAVERNPELTGLITQLEAHYDSTYESPQPQQQPTTELSPELEQFLRNLGQELQGPSSQ
jgi:hypothetical protein